MLVLIGPGYEQIPVALMGASGRAIGGASARTLKVWDLAVSDEPLCLGSSVPGRGINV